MHASRLLSLLGATALAAAVQLAPTRSEAAHEMVAFSGYPLGTIVIRTGERRLYFVVGWDRALRYPIGVGKAGQAWTGRSSVEIKQIRPAWSPPPDIKREHPRLPDYVPGGARDNPMGAAAMALKGGEYAIHGTNNPRSIGGFVSHGCIRMYNKDVLELYRLVPIGTPVVVLR